MTRRAAASCPDSVGVVASLLPGLQGSSLGKPAAGEWGPTVAGGRSMSPDSEQIRRRSGRRWGCEAAGGRASKKPGVKNGAFWNQTGG